MPSGLKTLVGEMRLEGGQEFVKYAGVSDTPDAFGAAAAIAFTGTAPVMFTSDGSLIDSAGDVTNGTIFMGVPEPPGIGPRGHGLRGHRAAPHLEMERRVMAAVTHIPGPAAPRRAGERRASRSSR